MNLVRGSDCPTLVAVASFLKQGTSLSQEDLCVIYGHARDHIVHAKKFYRGFLEKLTMDIDIFKPERSFYVLVHLALEMPMEKMAPETVEKDKFLLLVRMSQAITIALNYFFNWIIQKLKHDPVFTI
ncbi:hypothetical protein EXS45_00085 [Candidatus Nomurabacteria bacterium]|nr:hypothetical protein [Candidatus Nomurabacteria bacterium]